MHVLAKFFALPGHDEAVIELVSRALEVRTPSAIARGRAILCQNINSPCEIIYAAPAEEASPIEARLAGVESHLTPLLRKPVGIRLCKAGAAFRRWGIGTAVVAYIVVRVRPDQRHMVVERLQTVGSGMRARHPGMVGYRLLFDTADIGFIVMEHEWRDVESLAGFRRDPNIGFSKWITSELSGQYKRYEYRVRAMVEAEHPAHRPLHSNPASPL